LKGQWKDSKKPDTPPNTETFEGGEGGKKEKVIGKGLKKNVQASSSGTNQLRGSTIRRTGQLIDVPRIERERKVG